MDFRRIATVNFEYLEFCMNITFFEDFKLYPLLISIYILEHKSFKEFSCAVLSSSHALKNFHDLKLI